MLRPVVLAVALASAVAVAALASDPPRTAAGATLDEWRVREGVCAAWGNDSFLCPVVRGTAIAQKKTRRA